MAILYLKYVKTLWSKGLGEVLQRATTLPFLFVCQTMRLESICLVTAAPDNQQSAMFSDLIAPPSCGVLNNTGCICCEKNVVI